jgi:hypothetical protein
MPVNTASLKTFAPAMRRQLLEAVGRKLDLLLNSQTPDTLSTYAKQIAELREQEAENREQLLERVAYTWFNRLCALRYLDARGWHPFGCKVLMPAAEGETQPELLKLMRAGSLPTELKKFTDEQRLHKILDGLIPAQFQSGEAQVEVYRELLLAVCRFYNELLPDVFEKQDNCDELLLPGELLSSDSVAEKFRSQITDSDCEEIEVLGWLYQFYNKDLKQEVTSLKKLSAVHQIPPATQIFTPKWIVRFLVENSLSNNQSGVTERAPETDTRFRIKQKEYDHHVIRTKGPHELTVLDPACGSGHILIEAFRRIAKSYENHGYNRSEIPSLVFENNLFGIEICERAFQIAQISLLFCAREYSKRAFSQGLRPQIACISDNLLTRAISSAKRIQTTGKHIKGLDALLQQRIKRLSQTGSLERIDSALLPVKNIILNASKDTNNVTPLFLTDGGSIHRLTRVIDLLSKRYDVVVSNPPYMGARQMPAVLSEYVKSEYPASKGNLANCFIERCLDFLAVDGIAAMVTPESWMFTGTFEEFRSKIIRNTAIMSMIHIGHGGFEEGFGTTAFSIMKASGAETQTAFIDLRSFTDGYSKEQALGFNPVVVRKCLRSFLELPGHSFAYWITEKASESIRHAIPLETLSSPRQGMATGDNDKFVRYWHEVGFDNICFSATDLDGWNSQSRRWAPYSKGGSPRRWYGNAEHVLAFSQKDFRVLATQGNKLPARQFYFREAINWSLIGDAFAARYRPGGFVFDVNGMSSFSEGSPLNLLGLVNSKVGRYYLEIINPTLAFQVGDLKKFPCVGLADTCCEQEAAAAIAIAKHEWDSEETSWDFQKLQIALGESIPPVNEQNDISSLRKAVDASLQQSERERARLAELETEINRIWIARYMLEDQLEPQVDPSEISIFTNHRADYITCFLSYVIGCMMGRYSLDRPGLILADSRENQAEHVAAYEAKVGKHLSELKFKPDPDGIIPVLDGEWFEDDIVARTHEFLAVNFPMSSVAENLRFIEESFGNDIRKYFCSEFYKDHLQTYKKRPIYWMVQSPKKGFACLIYLHRYTKDTLNQVLNNYFRPYLKKLDARLERLGRDQVNQDLKPSERTAARKEAEKITNVLKECQAWEQDSLLPLALQRIPLDLDDGVKENYLKLQDVLAPIPGLAAKED